MRKRKTLPIAVLVGLLLAGVLAFGQDRGRHSPEPYRAVVTMPLKVGLRKAGSKVHELPELTEALNELDSEGYAAHSIAPFGDDRFVVVARKR